MTEQIFEQQIVGEDPGEAVAEQLHNEKSAAQDMRSLAKRTRRMRVEVGDGQTRFVLEAWLVAKVRGLIEVHLDSFPSFIRKIIEEVMPHLADGKDE